MKGSEGSSSTLAQVVKGIAAPQPRRRIHVLFMNRRGAHILSVFWVVLSIFSCFNL